MSIKQKKTAIKPPTLLEDFFQDRLSRYVEPNRKGTAKGDAIGLSRNKYKASLCFLYEFDARGTGGVKGVAKLLGVSYPLLKNWRSEELFKMTMLLHMVEFADVFFNFVEQLHKRKYGEHEAFFRKPLKRIAVDSNPSGIEAKDLELIADMRRYSSELVRCILIKHNNEVGKFDFAKATTFNLVLREFARNPTGEELAKLKELERQHDYVYMDKLLTIAIKPSISKADQKQLVYGLRLMKEKFQPPKDSSK